MHRFFRLPPPASCSPRGFWWHLCSDAALRRQPIRLSDRDGSGCPRTGRPAGISPAFRVRRRTARLLIERVSRETLSGILVRWEAGMGLGGSAAPSRRTGLFGYGSRARAAAALIDPKPGRLDPRLRRRRRPPAQASPGGRAGCRLVGFEPWSYDEAYIRLKGTADDLARDIRSIRGEEFDTVVCLILTEHLSDEVVAKIFDDLVAHTRIEGRIIVGADRDGIEGPAAGHDAGGPRAAATRPAAREPPGGRHRSAGLDAPGGGRVRIRGGRRPSGPAALAEASRARPDGDAIMAGPGPGSALNGHTFFVLRRVAGPPPAASQLPQA